MFISHFSHFSFCLTLLVYVHLSVLLSVPRPAPVNIKTVNVYTLFTVPYETLCKQKVQGI